MRFLRLLATLAGLLIVGSMFWDWGGGPTRSVGRAPQRVATSATTQPARADPWAVTPTQPEYRPTPTRLAEPDPTRVDIASIGVSSELVPLGLRADGTMEVPRDFAKAGWFTSGPKPGENGPAVIAGHVDNTSGPAVFYRLKALQPGAEIVVTRTDGTPVVFRVSNVRLYEKQAFPTAAVFGPTAASELRLVTCGGDFDWATRSYKANVVVFATRASA